jgi:hypothetical protein
MSALNPRERDLVKCEDMRIHASARAISLSPLPGLIAEKMANDNNNTDE